MKTVQFELPYQQLVAIIAGIIFSAYSNQSPDSHSHAVTAAEKIIKLAEERR